MYYQQTICRSGALSGIGLHSGESIKLKVIPLKEDSGIIFKRVDISCNNIIPAKFHNVINTKLCTEIANDSGIKVGTVEHLMAAFWGIGIDNILVEVAGPEVPAMDGSAKDFISLIKDLGVKKQCRKRKKLKILNTVKVVQDDKEITVSNSDNFAVDFSIDFEHKSIGRQNHKYANLQEFEKEIGNARTFGFANEVEHLKKKGLAKGASLKNVIGLNEDGIMNFEGLRYKDEFVRHKILDLLGDLFISGYRIIGNFQAKKSGHVLNNEILRKIFQIPGAYKIV